MAGSRRGDFSRLAFDPRKHDSGVHLQQGRVLLDSDWNALVDLLNHRLRTQARDFIGLTGVPAGDSGFRIIPRSALRFDGRFRYALLGAAAEYSRLDAATLELWIRPAATGRGGTFVSCFERAEGEGRGAYRYRLAVDQDDRIALYVAGAVDPLVRSEGRVAAGQWSRVQLAFDAARCRLFLDGSSQGESTQGIAVGDRDAIYVVGLAQAKLGEPPGFDGAIRGLRIWNRPLDPAAVERAERDGEAATLVGEWRFDEPDGGRVPDRTGNGNHAKLKSLREEGAPGLEIEDLWIGAGRCYVDGILCENEDEVPFAEQPDLPGARLPSLDGGDYLFYLDVWERFVTAAQDADLAEPALRGADTTVRSRVVAQVKWLRLPEGGEPQAAETECSGDGVAGALRPRAAGRLGVQRREGAAGELGNCLYRVEIHSGGAALGSDDDGDRLEVEKLEVKGTRSRVTLACRLDEPAQLGVGDWVALLGAEGDGGGPPLARVTAVEEGGSTVEVEGAPRQPQESDGLRLTRIATFKWSRVNGSVTLPIVHLESGSRVARLGRTCSGEPPLSIGDWVEICDDHTILRQEPRPLLRIEDLDPQTLTVTLSASPGTVGSRPELHPVLRRWDQRGDREALAGGVVPARVGEPLRLESGLEVVFEGDGEYATGDYWAFATRSEAAGIVWPREARSGRPRVADGIDHHLTPLAVLRLREGGFTLGDCRRTFQPRTEDAVARGGDEMYGALKIRPEGGDDPALEVVGAARADVLYGKLGSDSAVDTFNLADGAVSAEKMAPDAGVVPPGYSILGESPEPPPGYVYSGCVLRVPVPDPAWETRYELANSDNVTELHSATLGHKVYTLGDSGQLWEYDPLRQEVTPRQRAPESRCGFALAESYGKLYVLGGADESGRKVGAVLVYDPGTDGWSERSPLPTPRTHAAVAQFNGDLYVMGGLRDLAFLEVVSGRTEVYDPVSDAWTRGSSVPAPRFGSAAVAGSRAIHLLGGERKWFLRSLGKSLSGHSQTYLPGLGRWSSAANLPAPRSRSGAAVVGEKILLAGGRSLLGWMGETAVYTPQEDFWGRAASSPPSPGRPGVAGVEGKLILHALNATRDVIEVRELHMSYAFYVHTKSIADRPSAGAVPRLEIDRPEE